MSYLNISQRKRQFFFLGNQADMTRLFAFGLVVLAPPPVRQQQILAVNGDNRHNLAFFPPRLGFYYGTYTIHGSSPARFVSNSYPVSVTNTVCS